MSPVRAKSTNRVHRDAFADDSHYALGGIALPTPPSTGGNNQSERLNADRVLIEHADKDGVVFILRLGEFFHVLGSSKPRVVRSMQQICGAVFRDRPGAKGCVTDYSFHSGDHLHFRFTGIAASDRHDCAEMIVDTIGERILGDRFVSFARTRDLAKRRAVISRQEASLTTPAEIDAAYSSARRDANPPVGHDWQPVRKLNMDNVEPRNLHDTLASENDWRIRREPIAAADSQTRRVAVTQTEDWLLIRDIQARHPNVTDIDALLAEARALGRQTARNDWAAPQKRRPSKTAKGDLRVDDQPASAVDRKARRQAIEMARNGTMESAPPTAKAATSRKMERKG